MTDASGGMIKKDWWDVSDPEEAHKTAWPVAQWMVQEDRPRLEAYANWARLYLNTKITGLMPDEYDHHSPPTDKDRMTVDLVRPMIDSAQARIAKNRPRPAALTEGGSFGLQQKAKRLERFASGLIYRNKLYQSGPLVFRDGQIYGTGLWKVFSSVRDDVGRVHVERVYPWEVHVDPFEAYYGKPMTVCQTKWIDRKKLIADFPDKEAQIAKSSSGMSGMGHDFTPGRDILADQLLVVEIWRRESHAEAGDGWHTIVLSDCTLVPLEQWDGDPPFATFRWTEPLVGFWGIGVPQSAQAIQSEVNRYADSIQQGDRLMSHPYWIIPAEANVQQTKIANIPGNFVKYEGAIPPQMQVNSTAHPSRYQYFERLYSLGFEQEGISQLSAQSKKPSGLDAAVALREFNDIESERFVLRGQAYEQLYLDVSLLMFAEARRLDKAGVEVEVTAQRKRRRQTFLESIRWGDVNMDDEVFELKIFPASSLPQTPAFRLQMVQELIQSGMISKDDGMLLLDMPDIESAIERQLSPYHIILDIIDDMVEEERYTPPEPFDDLVLGLDVMRKAYLRARIDGVPDSIRALMRKWMTTAEATLNGPPGQPPPGPNGGGNVVPEAAPAPVPVGAPGGNAPPVGAPMAG